MSCEPVHPGVSLYVLQNRHIEIWWQNKVPSQVFPWCRTTERVHQASGNQLCFKAHLRGHGCERLSPCRYCCCKTPLSAGQPNAAGLLEAAEIFCPKTRNIWAKNGLLHQNVPRSSLLQDLKNGFPGLKVDDPLPSLVRATRAAAMLKNSCGRRRSHSELVFGVPISDPSTVEHLEVKINLFLSEISYVNVRRLLHGLVVRRLIVRSRTWRSTVQSSKMKVMIYAQPFVRYLDSLNNMRAVRNESVTWRWWGAM